MNPFYQNRRMSLQLSNEFGPPSAFFADERNLIALKGARAKGCKSEHAEGRACGDPGTVPMAVDIGGQFLNP
jgi:hypothetical protein